MFSEILIRLRALFRRDTVESELDEELRFHIDHQIEKLIRGGMSLAEATRRARLIVGTPDKIKEECRDARGTRFLEDFFQDIRYAVRILRKSAGFTAVAVLTLGLGIGASTAIFTVVNSVLLRPLPYKNPSSLYWVTNYRPRFHGPLVTGSEFLAWRDQNTVFEEMSAYAESSANLISDREPERLSCAIVTANLFSMLGAKPIVGRNFVDAENQIGASAVVILTYHLWQQQYGADPNIVGRSIDLDDRSLEIVGVMPIDFRFPDNDFSPELFVPIPLGVKPDWSPQTGQRIVQVLARLKPGVSPERAISDLATMDRWIVKQHPASFASAANGMEPRVTKLYDKLVGNARPSLLILFGAVSLLLVISCANVANLQLARSSVRHREFAIRMAIGAGRSRVVRQLLTENVLLTTVAASLGLLVARAGIQLFHLTAPSGIPHPETVTLDGWALGFTMIIAVATGIFFGLAPASVTFQTDLNRTLSEGNGKAGIAPSRIRIRGALVVSEIALALVVMASAALLFSSLVKLLGVSPGFNSRNVLVAQLELPPTAYGTPERQIAFANHLLETISALPGVSSAALGSTVPMTRYDRSFTFSIKGSPDLPSGLRLNVPVIEVSPEYFRVLGIQFFRGRPFSGEDRVGAPNVVIINREFANRYLGATNPLEQSIHFGIDPDTLWRPIVGIVENERHLGLDINVSPQVYTPIAQQGLPYLQVALRAESNPAAVAAELKQAVRQLDPNLPVFDVSTMDDRLSKSVSARRFDVMLLGIFAGAALVVAGMGVYGVVSYAASQRVHEFGIRIALGAAPRDVLKLVMGQGMRVALTGVVAGVLGALAITRLLRGMLFEVTPSDPIAITAVTGLLIAVALVACWIPARRATRVDPIVVLRYE